MDEQVPVGTLFGEKRTYCSEYCSVELFNLPIISLLLYNVVNPSCTAMMQHLEWHKGDTTWVLLSDSNRYGGPYGITHLSAKTRSVLRDAMLWIGTTCVIFLKPSMITTRCTFSRAVRCSGLKMSMDTYASGLVGDTPSRFSPDRDVRHARECDGCNFSPSSTRPDPLTTSKVVFAM